MSQIGFQQFQEVSRLFIRTNEPAQFRVRKIRPKLVEITLDNTIAELKNNLRHLDTRYFDSPVVMIRPQAIEGASPSIRIHVRLRSDVRVIDSHKDNLITLDFPRDE